jgi:beta-N-acetylhexosaminidase
LEFKNREVSTVVNRDIREKIAQMIMVGFKGTELKEDSPVSRALKEFSLGGVILYNIDLPCYLEEQKKNPALTRFDGAKICPKNIVSPGQLKALTSSLKSFAAIPPLIAVDQEGGLVSRLGPAAGYSERESPQRLGEKDDPSWTARVGEEIARDLKDCGINLNLAPVVDLAVNREGFIARNGRSFGQDPDLATRHARAFIQSHRQQGVLTCLKHFPGKGGAGPDTHYEVADVTDSYQERELLPFSRLIDERMADLVMTAHIHHRGWDEDLPVTLSRRVLQGILREKLGYAGVIISDDLQMGAIVKRYSLEEACILAVEGGVDILLASDNSPEGDDPELFMRIYSALIQGIEKGRISSTQIETAHSRIRALKSSSG